MLGFLKFVVFVAMAVGVGILIGTVPVDGKTTADRLVATYRAGQGKKIAEPREPASEEPSRAEKSSRGTARSRVAPPHVPVHAKAEMKPVAPSAPAGPVTAGAANTPDGHGDDDRAALDRIIAARAKK